MKPNMTVEATLLRTFKDISNSYRASVSISLNVYGTNVVSLTGGNGKCILMKTYTSQNAALAKYNDICEHIDQYVEDDYNERNTL